uniref:pyridoxal-phosphate dependent enzyme n=1 Tax=Vibrio cholerae TaxID=666 RepID=UPI003F58C282
MQPGDTIIEATSGNTGIALAMAAAIKGYKMILIMPDNATQERKDSTRAYGAELILVSKEQGMEGARDLALQMQQEGKGKVLDQFNNLDNPDAHYRSTGPEIWQQSQGKITHFVSSMGTTGTIMGVSRYLKQQIRRSRSSAYNPRKAVQFPAFAVGRKPTSPGIFDAARVDQVLDVTQTDAEQTARTLAREEGICAGVSSGGAVFAALQIAQQNPGSVVVAIVCDRGDRYLSSGLFS